MSQEIHSLQEEVDKLFHSKLDEIEEEIALKVEKKLSKRISEKVESNESASLDKRNGFHPQKARQKKLFDPLAGP